MASTRYRTSPCRRVAPRLRDHARRGGPRGRPGRGRGVAARHPAPLRGQPGAGARERPGVRRARRRQGRCRGRVRSPARVDLKSDGPGHTAYDRGERHRRADRGPRGAARSAATGRRPPAKTAKTSRFTPLLPCVRNTTAVVKVAFNFAWNQLFERYRRDRV